jgi:hypothetical protein
MSWGGVLFMPAFLPANAVAVLLLCVVLLQLDDIKQFRQWDSKTPGHPENFLTPGVEVTTGECWANKVGLEVTLYDRGVQAVESKALG